MRPPAAADASCPPRYNYAPLLPRHDPARTSSLRMTRKIDPGDDDAVNRRL
jgi:hypothetical protein